MGSDWSLRSLFDRSIPRSCNIATSSVVRVMLPSASEGGFYTLSPEPWMSTEDGVASYDLTNGKDVVFDRWGETCSQSTRGTSELDIAMTWPEEQRFSYRMRLLPLYVAVLIEISAIDLSPLSDLSVRRTLKGSSQTHGELSVVIRNNQPVTVRTHYLETMPWHVEFFLHTLVVSCGDGTKCGMWSKKRALFA